MDLKLKIASFKRNFIVSKHRKIKQLIKLYSDYTDFIKNDVTRKNNEKIAIYKESLFREYQRNYFDTASEKEIFDTIYAHKLDEYKKEYRLKFRVVRENLRREAAKYMKEANSLKEKLGKLISFKETYEEEVKLPVREAVCIKLSFKEAIRNALYETHNIKSNEIKYSSLTKQEQERISLQLDKNKIEIDEIEQKIKQNIDKHGEILARIPIEEGKYATLALEEAKKLKDEFELQCEKGLLRNAKGGSTPNKEEVENKVNDFSNKLNEKTSLKLERKIKNINKKVGKLETKLGIYDTKVKKIIEEYSKLDSQSTSDESMKKIQKLKEEIGKYTAKFDSSSNEKEKERLQKILNSLRGDLELLSSSTLTREELLKDDDVIAINDLCMYFGGIRAVNHLSFNVKEKEIFGLIGPNGAGKTTVFNCITQFYKPTAGQIYFRNKNNEIVDLTKEIVHNVILQGIVRTFQNLEVIKDITVLDNLLVAAHRSYTSNVFQHMFHTPILKVEESVIRERAIKVLEFMGILKYKDMYAWGLPYGILKKIEIARTLMCDPQLIILDEPAAGLNDSETVELADLIRRIRDEYNTTILLVEHDMGLVMDVCDRICAISFGNLLALGTPTEIQNNKAVQEAYLGVSED